jgi:hypothetical protein
VFLSTINIQKGKILDLSMNMVNRWAHQTSDLALIRSGGAYTRINTIVIPKRTCLPLLPRNRIFGKEKGVSARTSRIAHQLKIWSVSRFIYFPMTYVYGNIRWALNFPLEINFSLKGI